MVKIVKKLNRNATVVWNIIQYVVSDTCMKLFVKNIKILLNFFYKLQI